MAIPYKHTCSVCKTEFLSKFRGQNICSKKCRSSIKRTPTKEKGMIKRCIICGWDPTTDTHHENGKEYVLCPNHHSLLTRGKQGLEEVLEGIIYSPIALICPILEGRFDDLTSCPIINGSYKKTIPTIDISLIAEELYQRLKIFKIVEFQYKDIVKLTNWSYEKVKKYVLELEEKDRIKYIKISKGGRCKRVGFKML